MKKSQLAGQLVGVRRAFNSTRLGSWVPPARLPQSAGLPPPGDLLAVRQAQALIAAMPRGLPPPRAHPPGVLSQVRSSSPVGGEPVGSDREPAGAPLEGIADGKGVADDAPLVGDKARTA